MPDDQGTTAAVDAGLRREITALLPDLRAFARFLARDRAAADDLVQDTVVRALAALGQFTPGTNLKAWLFTIQRNAFYEGMRRRRREDAAMRGRVAEAEAAAPQQFARSEISDLQQVIWTLPPLLREALILVAAQELTHEEAAAICGVTPEALRQRLHRARTMLSQRLEASTGPTLTRPSEVVS